MGKRITLELSEAERVTLQELEKHHPHQDFRRRARGLLALDREHGVSRVAEILCVSTQSVRNWVARWKDDGVVGILDGHKGGRPAKITAEMLETGKKLASEHPLTLREIAEGIRAAHPEAPEFSLWRLSVGLKAQGLRFIRTRLSLKKTG